MAGGNTVRNVSRARVTSIVLIVAASLALSVHDAFAQAKKTAPKKQETIGERLSKKSLHYLETKDIAKALIYANEAVKLAPKEGMPYFARASVYYENKRGELALEQINKSISYDPNYADAYLLRVRINLILDRLDTKTLEADLNKAKSIDPNAKDLYDGLGVLYAVQKRYDKAAEALTQAIKQTPNKTKLYIHRSMAYSALRQYDKSIADCTMCIKLNPNETDGFVRRATAYELIGKNDLAVADYSQAIKINPRDYGTIKTRAALYSKMRRHEDAIKDYTYLLEMNPYDDDFLLLRGNEYRKLKQYQKAIDDYSEAISLSPEFARASYVARSEVYGLMGKKELSERDRTKVHQLDKQPAERGL